MRAWMLLLGLLVATPLPAQHGGGASGSASPPAQARQFDFLVGYWELSVTPKVSGLAAAIHGAPKLSGTWKAWRAFDGRGIEDELRVVDGNGNPRSLGHALRIWSDAEQRWIVTLLDAYRARFTTGRANFGDGVMQVDGSGTNAEGQGYRSRTRFHDISGDAFVMTQDRSYDEGASWDEAVLVIEAKRIAAAAPH